MDNLVSDIQVVGRVDERGDEILTPDALAFVEELPRRFGGRRPELLRRRRVQRESDLPSGGVWIPSRDAGGAHIGMDRSASTRRDLVDRRVEITGPPEPKMAFNPTVGAFVDFGPYFFHSARELPDRGSGRYFYLPKTESHPEA